MSRRRRNWLLMFVVLVFIVVLRAFTGPVPPDTDFLTGPQPLVIAERGGYALRPENTLIAVAHAQSLGVQGVHLNVRSTADNELVALHDATLDRTTDAQGEVRELLWADLDGLDAAASWTDAQGAQPYRGRSVGVPSIRTVLERFPALRFNLELMASGARDAELLCQLLTEQGEGARVLVSSANRTAMLAFRAACPAVATSAFELEILTLNLHARLGLMGVYRPRANALVMATSVYGFDPEEPELVAAAASRGLPLLRFVASVEALDAPAEAHDVAVQAGWIGPDPAALLARRQQIRNQ